MRARVGWVAPALIALVCLWFWVVAVHRIDGQPFAGFAGVFVTGCGDFEHFYLAAQAMREGRDIYASGVHGYIYPPLIAFLFMPLTLFPVKTAALIMLVLNIALGLGCAWIASAEAIRRFQIAASPHKVVLVVAVTLLLSATKLRSEFQMWQTNVLMMFAMLLALRFLDARPRLAGLLLGAAVNIKYLPLVFLPYLLLRRRYKAAAAFVGGIVGFALLPALGSGWGANLQHWQTALSGLAQLLGLPVQAAQVAHIDPISVGHSISITSGVSRLMGAGADPADALAVAGLLALALGLWLRLIYVERAKPLIAWPRAIAQRAQPYLGTLALEWAALMALALAFSPQTNPRHTSLTLMVFAPLAAMLCFPRPGGSRVPAIVATAILFCGLVLPPNLPLFADPLQWWRDVGGAGWCMALMLPFYFIAGFNYLGLHAAEAQPLVEPKPLTVE